MSPAACGSAPVDGAGGEPDLVATTEEALWTDGDFQRIPEQRGDLVGTIAALPIDSTLVLLREPRATRVREMMRAVFDARATGAWCSASAAVANAGYRIRRFYDQGTYGGTSVRAARYHLLLTDATSDHQATIVINPSPARNVIVETPHAGYDTGTQREGAYIYRELGARALLLNRARRCALSALSTCSAPERGTSVCTNFADNYPKSDAAHWHEGALHHAHVELERRYHPLAVQLHVMMLKPSIWAVAANGRKASLGDDAGAISNRFRNALQGLVDDYGGQACSCQMSTDVRHEAMCGEQNVQGLFTNSGGSLALTNCSTSTYDANDRFLHVEQSEELVAERPSLVRKALLSTVGGCTSGAGASDCVSAMTARSATSACP